MSAPTTNGASSSTSTAAAPATASSNAPAEKPPVQPSEVGWLFVTQYYTFLNQNPGRLHRFFTKKSTMLHGTEQEESTPCFGQQQIHDKITSLGFEDAKVFVSNVDTQTSASGGILIQVLGELSNKGGAWKKFAQTFFLAEQPGGYFVLNDIFRYLKDEEEAEAEAEAVDEAIQNEIDEADKEGREVVHQLEINNIGDANAIPNLPAPSANSKALVSSAIDGAAQQDQRVAALESTEANTDEPASAVQEDATPATTVSTTEAQPTEAAPVQVGTDKKVTTSPAEQAPVAPKAASDAAAAAATSAPVASKPEASASASAPAPTPAEPAAPPKPKTWATLAASDVTRWGSNVSAEAKGVSSSRPAPAATASKPAAAKANGNVNAAAASPSSSSSSSSSTSVYIKNVVPEQVTDAALRSALEAFGTVKDVQIIPARSCAFAEFTSVEGAKKAAAKGTVAVGKNGWNVTVEERRKQQPAAGGAGGRGGSSQRGGGRGGSTAQRGGGNAARGGRGAARAGGN